MTRNWKLGLLIAFLALQANAQDASPLKSTQDKVSYAIGLSFAKSLKAEGIDVNADIMVKGLKDALGNGKVLLTDDELKATLTAFQNALKAKQDQANAAESDTNKKAGDAFLAANAKQSGVMIGPGGLQYKILKAATGRKPTDDDKVLCNYRGTLVDGTEFDSSYPSGKPATFQVKALVPGVRAALKLMPVGSKWQIVVPPDLAYGERGAGEVGPNATLVFEIELVSIE